MAFVRERYADEYKEQIERLTAQLKQRITPLAWVIDRERDAFLLCFSVGRDSPYEGESTPGFYALSWAGEVVTFEAYCSDSDHPSGTGFLTNYTLLRIRIPASLEEKRNAVLDLIREAMLVQGKHYPNTADVIVNI